MSKLKLYIFILILNLCFTKKKAGNNQTVATTNNENKSVQPQAKLLQTLYSDSYSNNYYYATLYISDKQVKQTYMIDTGSPIMSSPCGPCEYCGKHKTNYFDFNKKILSQPLKCGSEVCKLVPASGCLAKDKDIANKDCSFFKQKTNGDGLRGYYLSNIVYFEENKNLTSPQEKKVYRSFAIPVGCTLEEYGKFKDLKTDGILGLNNQKRSFSTLLYNLKIIKKNVFSLCLGLDGGYMSLGNIDYDYHTSKNIKYVPLLNSTNYLINLNGIQIGTNKRNKFSLVANIDTASPFTYLPNNLYQSIVKEFDELCTKKNGKNKCGKFQNDSNLGYCTSFKDRETLFEKVNENWPDITLELHKSIEYQWKPINYYYYYINKDERKACLGILSHQYAYAILGSNFMHGHDIIFDKDSQSMGFVEADCSRKPASPNKGKKNAAAEDKEIHKNEKENKFGNEDNDSKEKVEFIKGKNKELQIHSSEHNLTKLILILIFVLIIVVVLLIVIIYLICNKIEYIKLEKQNNALSDETKKLTHEESNNLNIIETQDDLKENKEEPEEDNINQEIQFLKNIMKKKK